MAAGLGGGSSDAAAVLSAVNVLMGTGLGSMHLRKSGRVSAWMSLFSFTGLLLWQKAGGNGDERLPPRFWVLLVNPGFELQPWVYQNLNLRLTKKGRL